ncbi:MAG TPA: ATPase domain-containing protein [Candidatus Bathyarchaeia archaeon]|nr:ATPase domain-containing protein [Candidatus Bathyarchaeia archaeon]
MRLRAIPAVVLLALAMVITSVAAPPAYTLTVSPTVPVSLGTSVTLTLSMNGGTGGSGTIYNTAITVRKPNGAGQAIAIQSITINNAGTGSVSLPYPDPSFTPSQGTVATDVGGVYSVIANQTGPNIGIVATAQFTVSSQLTVVLSTPGSGVMVQRGGTVLISVTVSSPSGPDTGATVYANTPNNGRVYLVQTGTGVYTINYQVLYSDPIGSWTIIVQATDTQGNSGSSSPVTVILTKNDLIVESLVTYNSRGLPATEFSPGDLVNVFFRIRYSSGTYLTTGQFAITLQNPSGVRAANMTASYDATRFGFYTATGYPVSTSTASGSWTVVIKANSINDGYGNTGPGINTSVPLQVAAPPVSPLSYWSYVVGALAAALVGFVLLKRFHGSTGGFEHLEEMMGGPVPRGTSLLLLGDPGSGKTILAYEMMYEELEARRLVALLSYDAFPEDVQARMDEFGWDIIGHLRKYRLRIIDCYSGLTGRGGEAIKDPSDLTELNIQITAIIASARNYPVTIIIDSLTPIFNGVNEKQAFSFLQTVAAKVKRTGGLFIMTATKGAISEESTAKIKSVVDGVIELSTERVGRRAQRYLSVLKMEHRRTSGDAEPFEINRTRGLVFHISRLGYLKKRLRNIQLHRKHKPRVVRARAPEPVRKTIPHRSR